MQFLIDTSPKNFFENFEGRAMVGGQLITPLTSYANAKKKYAVDNGAYSNFQRRNFERVVNRDAEFRDNCLFVTMPDVVGNARRTLEIFKLRHTFPFLVNWPIALVAQDGLEDLEVPWEEIDCLFVGGRDPWKDSQSSADLVKTAKILSKHVHVGRVNNLARYEHFKKLGADTCDGSGIAKYRHMLLRIEEGHTEVPEDNFFNETCEEPASPIWLNYFPS